MEKGEIQFDYYTKSGDYINVNAVVSFDKFGEQEIESIELMDENGYETSFDKFSLNDRNSIEEQILSKCIPQDEVYDDYEIFEDME